MSLKLPTEPRERPKPTLDGSMFLVIGEPKTGKTGLAMGWPGCLHIDTQGGARHYAGMTVDVRAIADAEGKSDLAVFREVVSDVKGDPSRFSAVAIDTLDDVSGWLEAEAVAACNRKMGKRYQSIEDVPHGAGWGEHRRLVMNMLKVFHRLPLTTLIIAHSRRMIDEDTKDVSRVIDVPGKLAHMVPGEVDHIAIASRTKEGEYILDFSGYEAPGQKGATVRQSGSRLEELNGKTINNGYEHIMEALG